MGVKLLWAAAVVFAMAGCGSDASLDDPALGCVTSDDASPMAFATSAEFAPAVRGTLAGWDPDGRWFLTGVRVGGVSSYHFQRAGSQVIVDRDARSPGTI